MRILVMACSLLALGSAAVAQTLEVGGRVAAGCVGSDGSICDDGTHPLLGAHASLWVTDGVELSAGFSRLFLPDQRFAAFDAPAIEIERTDRKRDLLSFLLVYHFMRDSPVRPMLGLGSGWFSDAQRTACRPAGCETQLRPGPDLGQFRTWDVDVLFVVGLSGEVGERWIWRGGWQSHRFANDENSTQQVFVSAGYKFGH